MPGRIVSADIAGDWNHHEGDLTEGDLAHTVEVQAEQIAAVLDLHERVDGGSASDDYCDHCNAFGGSSGSMRLIFYPCPTAQALGVTA